MFWPSVVSCFSCALADAPGGIEDHDANAGNSQERLRHRAARVARCRHDNGELLSRFRHKISHQPRHESRAKILERQRRSVKQLQNMQPFAERDQRHRENETLRSRSSPARAEEFPRPRTARPLLVRFPETKATAGAPRKSAGRCGMSTGMYSPPSGAEPRRTASRRETSGLRRSVLRNFIMRAGPAHREVPEIRARRDSAFRRRSSETMRCA